MRTIGAIVMVAALVACGNGASPVATITSPTTDSTAGEAGQPSTTTAPAAATTTVASAPATTAPTETTSPPTTVASPIGLTVFFLSDQGGNEARQGPFLMPVHRTVPATTGVARAAIEELLAGPERNEASAGIDTAVPGTTLLLGVNIADGMATVDLTRDFESGGGTTSMTARLAQLVYTVTQFPTVDAVELLLDGEPVEVFSAEGIVIDGPLTREAFLDYVPQIMVETPGWGGTLGNPGRIAGIAAVFEAVFQVRLADAEGEVLYEDFAMTTEGQGWGTFDTTLEYTVDEPQMGTLRVWEDSPEDGSETGVSELPVEVAPPG
jgi:spore germination protein GerM